MFVIFFSVQKTGILEFASLGTMEKNIDHQLVYGYNLYTVPQPSRNKPMTKPDW